MNKRWEIIEKQVGYQGFFRIENYTVRHEKFAGGWSEPMHREVFERGHAAAMLPYDPDRDELLVIEQFRIGAIHHPEGPWLLEPVAGIIDAGETPEAVVRREVVEEAGCTVDRLEHICDYLVSPGGTTEQISLYCGCSDLSNAGGIHGLDHEGEDIRVEALPAGEVLAMLHGNHIHNAMMLIALLWFEREHERLRRVWRRPT